MENIEISATPRTPEVSFDFAGNVLALSGESYPEDVTIFYNPLFDALDAYLAEMHSGDCRFEFKLVYFNSSSAKALMMLMEKLDDAAKSGNSISIGWYYDPEDETMQELGEEFGEDLEHAVFQLRELTE